MPRQDNIPCITLLFILLALAALPAGAAMRPVAAGPDSAYRFGPCFAALKGDLLTAGNGEIERAWRVNPYGSLAAVSFRDLAGGREWIAGGRAGGARATAGEQQSAMHLSALQGQAGATEEPSLLATLAVRRGPWIIETHLKIFAGARGILMSREARRTGGDDQNAEGLTCDDLNELESFAPAPRQWTLGRVKFIDQTDQHEGPLVAEARDGNPMPRTDAKDEAEIMRGEDGPQGYHEFQGNLFFIEDRETSAGMIFLKHAPLPKARPLPPGFDRKNVFDFAWQHSGEITFQDIGIEQAGGATYRWVTLAYQGGRAGRIAALQQYYRNLRVYEPTRDGLLLTNTWGDRSKDGRVSEAFMKKEIEAAARLGVDVIEIDDGWQKGTTANSVNKGGVWNGFYAKDDNFWSAHPERFPGGIKPLADLAKNKGMRFGLWFAPDSTDNFKNWQKDRDLVLGMYRERGVNYFKFDGIKIHSRAGEANVRRLVGSVIEGSQGHVSIDLDVTAEVRPGYFGIPNHGPIFVENRYTDTAAPEPEKKSNSYWPYKTLRNFWLLAQYVDPVRLRMEFLNNSRNIEKYGNNPLAPANYSPDTLFAIVMFGSPLGWFETQNLPPSYQEKAAPLIKIWKAHREAIFDGSIIPVGDVPSGKSWTGFVSAAPNRKSAYALVFRELNDKKTWSAALPLLERGNYDAQVLAGAGQATVKDGNLSVEIPTERGYVLVRIVRKG